MKSKDAGVLRVYLISKARLGIWDRRYCSYFGVDPDVTKPVRKFITRGFAAGLVATSTTGGTHATGSYHFQEIDGQGRAADMGHRSDISAAEGQRRKEAFQRDEFGRRHKTRPAELIGPINNRCVLRGVDASLGEGTDLEQAHDNHVHGAW
jgi:hypothetical protein